MKSPVFSDLVGKTLVEVIEESDKITFKTNEGEAYKLYHQQDCCEYVTVDDITGDIKDLIGSPILKAEESVNNELPAKSNHDESYTWTFYQLATINGYVTIRWYGTSNGYYSERVEFVKL